jgi:hypothetical protein
MSYVALAVGIAGLAVTAGKAIGDGKQRRKSARESEKALKNRPKYEIPQEIFQNQQMYEAMANSSRVPGQAQMEENIGKSTAQAVSQAQRTAGSSADALSAVSGIQQGQNEALMNLGMLGQQQQAINRDKLATSRETVADYRQQKFDYNKNEPWKIRYAQKQKELDQKKIDTANTYDSLGQSIGTLGSAASSYKSR